MTTPPRLDAIRGDSVYPASVVRSRLGWEKRSWAHAKREGLRVVQFGRFAYVLGADMLAFFERLAERQNGEDGREAGGQ
jgi:hypothetical protein